MEMIYRQVDDSITLDDMMMAAFPRWMSMWLKKLTGEKLSFSNIESVLFDFRGNRLILNIKVTTPDFSHTAQYSTYPEQVKAFMIDLIQFTFEDE